MNLTYFTYFMCNQHSKTFFIQNIHHKVVAVFTVRTVYNNLTNCLTELIVFKNFRPWAVALNFTLCPNL